MKKFAIAVAVVVLAALAAPAFAAMNPFMDVPASHWAYDAVAQLAARGVISGYPDGTYKGAKPTTRYEMASALARALAKIDMEKASKQDVEMLKRLIVEFKDELDALGVKVDKIDARVAVLEKDLGGWSLAGELRFDAKFMSEEGNLHGHYANSNYNPRTDANKHKNDFHLGRYRIWLRKRINETTSFTARLGAGYNDRVGNGRAGMLWEQYYITTKLGYDITMHAGVKAFDWEGQYGFANYKFMDDAYFGDAHLASFHFIKSWGKANLELVVGRLNDNTGLPQSAWYDDATSTWGTNAAGTDYRETFEQFLVAALAHYDFSEQFGGGIFAYFQFNSGDERSVLDQNGNTVVGSDVNTDTKLTTYGAFFNFKFNPTVELKAIYYHQSQGDYWKSVSWNGNEDSAKMWRAILDVKQEALKFTSLWLEYGQIDNNFVRLNAPNAWGYYNVADSLRDSYVKGTDGTRKQWVIRADQQWNEKWRTFVSYRNIDYGIDFHRAGVDIDNATNWNIGVAYRLNPAVEFELAYDKIDYGDLTVGGNKTSLGDDGMIRFRTHVTF